MLEFDLVELVEMVVWVLIMTQIITQPGLMVLQAVVEQQLVQQTVHEVPMVVAVQIPIGMGVKDKMVLTALLGRMLPQLRLQQIIHLTTTGFQMERVLLVPMAKVVAVVKVVAAVAASLELSATTVVAPVAVVAALVAKEEQPAQAVLEEVDPLEFTELTLQPMQQLKTSLLTFLVLLLLEVVLGRVVPVVEEAAVKEETTQAYLEVGL